MRFKELLEYKRDITTANLGERLVKEITLSAQSPIGNTVQKLKQIIPGIEISKGRNDADVQTTMASVGAHIDDVLKFFEDADPTANKQYTEWIIRRYLDGGIRFLEDVDSTVAENLAIYHELKTRRMISPELSDIGKVKGARVPQFFRNVRDIYDKLPEQQEKKEKGNAEEFYSDNDIRIVIPEDRTAACYYGQGTQWCTASTRSRNYFDSYNSEGPLYIILPKNPEHEGEKYQLHFATDFYANENDKGVRFLSLIKRWPQLHKVFYTEYITAWNNSDVMRGSVYLATPETLENWEDITHDMIPSIEKYLETPVSIYNWLGLATIVARYKYGLKLDGDYRHAGLTTDEIHRQELKINMFDVITEYMSTNKDKTLNIINEIILDLTEINTTIKYLTPTSAILNNIYSMFPPIEDSELVKLGQQRVLKDIRLKIANQIWIEISRYLDPYFQDVFDARFDEDDD